MGSRSEKNACTPIYKRTPARKPRYCSFKKLHHLSRHRTLSFGGKHRGNQFDRFFEGNGGTQVACNKKSVVVPVKLDSLLSYVMDNNSGHGHEQAAELFSRNSGQRRHLQPRIPMAVDAIFREARLMMHEWKDFVCCNNERHHIC